MSLSYQIFMWRSENHWKAYRLYLARPLKTHLCIQPSQQLWGKIQLFKSSCRCIYSISGCNLGKFKKKKNPLRAENKNCQTNGKFPNAVKINATLISTKIYQFFSLLLIEHSKLLLPFFNKVRKTNFNGYVYSFSTCRRLSMSSMSDFCLHKMLGYMMTCS